LESTIIIKGVSECKMDDSSKKKARGAASFPGNNTNKNANNNRKRTSFQMLALGVLLGWAACSTLSSIRNADNQLRASTYSHDHALGAIPPNLPTNCDEETKKGTSTSTTSSTTPPKKRSAKETNDQSRPQDASGTTKTAKAFEELPNVMRSQTISSVETNDTSHAPPRARNNTDAVVKHATESASSSKLVNPPTTTANQQATTRNTNNAVVKHTTESANSSTLVSPPTTTANQQATGNNNHKDTKEMKKENIITVSETNTTNKERRTSGGTSYVTGMGVEEFDPSVRAVIATKIHGSDTVEQLEQSLCLLTYAYNYRVNYDIVVFSSNPIKESELERIRSVVAPATLTFVVDNPGLQEMVDLLPAERRQHLLSRCNVTDSSELTWFTRCVEKSSRGLTNEKIAYAWQAEFRSLHIWTHPAIKKYKYMLWMDSDGFCSRVWEQDPIATMVRHDLVLLFDHFPQGTSKGEEWPYRFLEAFGTSNTTTNRTICSVKMENGTLSAKEGGCYGKKVSKGVQIPQVHGFFHVTNLDFYRSEPAMKWARVLIGDTKFSRMFDDQIGVTMSAAVLAGDRAWDMRYHGLHMNVVHNFLMDGQDPFGGFLYFWNTKGNVKKSFPEAYANCKVTSRG
jgi:hypothetical protein